MKSGFAVLGAVMLLGTAHPAWAQRVVDLGGADVALLHGYEQGLPRAFLQYEEDGPITFECTVEAVPNSPNPARRRFVDCTYSYQARASGAEMRFTAKHIAYIAVPRASAPNGRVRFKIYCRWGEGDLFYCNPGR